MTINNYQKLYKNAKRTAIIAHEKTTKKIYHIFSVIDFQPHDSYEYHIPKTDWFVDKKSSPYTFLQRSTVSCNDFTFSILVQDLKIENATDIFNNPISNNIIDGATNNFYNKTFRKEPSGDSPLVISPNLHDSKGLASVIPQRGCGSFVWTQIDSERDVARRFIRDFVSDEMKAIVQLSEEWLGFNLIEKSEHLGNIYLVATNPYYRSIKISLSTNPAGIFYQFNMRKGIKEKFEIRLVDKHSDNIALDKTFEIKEYFGLIELPHEPHLIELFIYNSQSDLIEKQGPFTFIKQIQLGISVKQADFNVHIDIRKEKKEFTVEKYSKEKPSIIGEKIVANLEHYFKDAEQDRAYIDLDKNDEFIYFPGSTLEHEKTEIRTNAKNRIENIINKSQDSCFLCDPYFNINDLIDFGFKIKGSGVKVRILNKRGKSFVNKDKARELKSAIDEFNSKPFEKIECRMLKDNLLHDRFIISDTNAWLLGSSFSEFGSRATCIGKIPKSYDTKIIKEIESWFYSEKYTQTLEDYLNMDCDE